MLTVRASEVGGCPRLLYHKLRGDELEEPEGAQRRVFQEGQDAEESILAWACEGLEVVSRQQEVSFDLDEFRVTGHMDALCRDNQGSLVVVEAKLMGKERFARAAEDNWPQQILDQVACYMYGASAQYALIAAQERNGEGRATKTLIAPAELQNILFDLSLLSAALEDANPDLIEWPLSEFGCQPCPARFHCYPRWRPWYAVGEEGALVAGKLHTLAVVAEAQAKLAAREAELKAELAAILDAHETDVLKPEGGGTVRWVESTRRTLNQKAIPQEIKDQLEPYYKESWSRHLRVFPPGQKGDDGEGDADGGQGGV